MRNPLEQFKLKLIYRIYDIYYDFSITNSTLLILLSTIVIIYISRPNKLIKLNKYEIIFINSYNKIGGLVGEIIGPNKKYIPLIFALFFFILINNLFGLIPYSFTTTSHIVINITISLSIILGTTLLGLYLHKFHFFSLFVPAGLTNGPTKFILPLIILIEIISYLSRIISLSVRLTANMLSGHILLSLISSFGFQLFTFSHIFIPFGLISIILLVPFILLEIAIAFIQSYVFILLTSSYIKDVIYLH